MWKLIRERRLHLLQDGVGVTGEGINLRVTRPRYIGHLVKKLMDILDLIHRQDGPLFVDDASAFSPRGCILALHCLLHRYIVNILIRVHYILHGYFILLVCVQGVVDHLARIYFMQKVHNALVYSRLC